jgi:hypothetical protein
VNWNSRTDRLESKLVSLADRQGDRLVPRRGPVTVRGVYSDFKYHDVGPRDRLTIIRSNANRKLGFQSIATGGHRISGPEQLRATDLSCEHAADDRFRHLPTPDERDSVG